MSQGEMAKNWELKYISLSNFTSFSFDDLSLDEKIFTFDKKKTQISTRLNSLGYDFHVCGTVPTLFWMVSLYNKIQETVLN